MPIASGIAKTLRYKVESTWGTAPGPSGAQLLRRKTSSFDLVKATLESEELRSDYQVADYRHGVRSVQGSITNELSCKTYQDMLAASLRASSTWSTAPTTGAQTNITASASAPHFTRAAGSFLTDGFKIGDIVRWTGWTAGASTNNSRNFLITALTATNMTGVFLDGTAVVAKTAGDSVTCTGFKSIHVPTTGHTDTSFAFEHYYSDIAQSELYLGCKPTRVALRIPGNDKASIELSFIGKDVQTASGAAYFTSPTAETTTGILTCLNGSLYYGGAAVAAVTNCEITIDGGHTPSEPVLGSTAIQAVFPGRVRVGGQLSVYWTDATFRDAFLNETTASLVLALASSGLAAAEAMTITLPKIKLNGSAKDDGEKGLLQTVPFVALLESTGGTGSAYEKTTIMIVDTEAA